MFVSIYVLQFRCDTNDRLLGQKQSVLNVVFEKLLLDPFIVVFLNPYFFSNEKIVKIEHLYKYMFSLMPCGQTIMYTLSNLSRKAIDKQRF